MPITSEKRKEYNLKFIEKNKDKVKEKNICISCGGSYTYYNKSKHEQTRRHTLHNILKFYHENHQEEKEEEEH